MSTDHPACRDWCNQDEPLLDRLGRNELPEAMLEHWYELTAAPDRGRRALIDAWSSAAFPLSILDGFTWRRPGE